jgi:hypothetical protein
MGFSYRGIRIIQDKMNGKEWTFSISPGYSIPKKTPEFPGLPIHESKPNKQVIENTLVGSLIKGSGCHPVVCQ